MAPSPPAAPPAAFGAPPAAIAFWSNEFTFWTAPPPGGSGLPWASKRGARAAFWAPPSGVPTCKSLRLIGRWSVRPLPPTTWARGARGGARRRGERKG
eukprot:2480376-Prymnesium_polylepis.1